MKPIVSLGDLVVDLVATIETLPVVANRHQLVDAFRVEPGGAGNFLIAGARLGQPMAAIGVLGDDAWGQHAAAILRDEQVDLARVRHVGTSTLVLALVDAHGEHVFLGHNGRADPVALDEADRALIERAGALFVAGYTLCELHLQQLTREALAFARSIDVPIFFDAGPLLANAPEALVRETLAQTETLLLTEDEIPLLPGNGEGDVAELLALGPRQVVLKRGAAGCEIWSFNGLRNRDGLRNWEPQKMVDAPGYAVPVVDTAAAGDCFAAAFIGATLRGESLADCASWANAVGAAAVQKVGGGRHVPTLAEAQRVYTDKEEHG